MNNEAFSKWMKSFIDHVKPTKENPVLLILDGHATHSKNLEAIMTARDSGVIMLSLPPHTTHKLKPLDFSFFKPLQTYYLQVCDKWLRNNPGRGLTVFQVAEISGKAFPRAASVKNITNGFRKLGIWPCGRNVFNYLDYEPSSRAIIHIPIANASSENQLSFTQPQSSKGNTSENLSPKSVPFTDSSTSTIVTSCANNSLMSSVSLPLHVVIEDPSNKQNSSSSANLRDCASFPMRWKFMLL